MPERIGQKRLRDYPMEFHAAMVALIVGQRGNLVPPLNARSEKRLVVQISNATVGARLVLHEAGSRSPLLARTLFPRDALGNLRRVLCSVGVIRTRFALRMEAVASGPVPTEVVNRHGAFAARAPLGTRGRLVRHRLRHKWHGYSQSTCWYGDGEVLISDVFFWKNYRLWCVSTSMDSVVPGERENTSL